METIIIDNEVIKLAINPMAQVMSAEKILMDKTIRNGRVMNEEQVLNVKPLFS